MHRGIANLLQVKEKFRYFAWKNRSDSKDTQYIIERRGARWQQPVAGCHLFCDEFAKLTEFDQCRRRVVEEIAFGKRAEAGKTLVLRGEKAEIAGNPHRGPNYTLRRPSSSNGCIINGSIVCYQRGIATRQVWTKRYFNNFMSCVNGRGLSQRSARPVFLQRG